MPKNVQKKPTKVLKKPTKVLKKHALPSSGLEEKDLHVIIDSEITEKTLVGHHIESFNRFTSIGIHQIVTELFQVDKDMPNERVKTKEDNEISNIHFNVKFTDIKIDRPTTQVYTSGKQNSLLPNLARRHGLNYSAPMYVDAIITATAFLKDGGEPRVRQEHIKNFRIASMPIMVNSKLCHLNGFSKEARKNAQEDHNEPGGYFILNGSEWVISMIESRLYNAPHIFRNVGHEKEVARLEIISKPGDAYENSSEMIIRYYNDGNIMLQLTSIPLVKTAEIPFYVLFRLMGMTTDKEIIDNIIYKTIKEDVVAEHMWNVLTTAFKASGRDFEKAKYMTDQGKLKDFLAVQASISWNATVSSIKKAADDNTIEYLKNTIMTSLDRFVFPHIGLARDSRHKKMRYLGHLMHKLLLVEYQIVPSTDRDSLKNKRIRPAGPSYAKSFKTQFNLAIVQTFRKKLIRDFKSIPFSQVPLAQSLKSSIRGPDLERALIQAITTGNKELTVKNRQIPNRLSSEILHRKNHLNYIATMGVIRTPSTSASKQDKRADEMRRVHPSYTGKICPISSSTTGETVGLVKQRAINASISLASVGEIIKEQLLEDKEILPLDKIFPHQIHEHQLTKVMVNGDWVGCCKNSPRIVQKYREYRRGFTLDGKPDDTVINPKTTIHLDTETNEIYFWSDAGRMMSPLLIVRNNGELDKIGQKLFGSRYNPYKNTGFIQDIVFTKDNADDMLAESLTVSDLHKMGIIDYISPEEMENCLIAPSLDELKENQNNPLLQYTHCEIPIALLGMPALTCPFANHDQIPRVTYQTSQVKQTCGWYTLNWPFRVDKHAFLQYYCEIPLVRTFANKHTYPNGLNAIVGIAAYGGSNQEDSLIYNQSAADRGLYKGLHFSFMGATLDKEEKFGNPNESNTMDIMKHANYEHLANGHVTKGTKLNKGDVIIGKQLELPKQLDRYKYKDTSIMYHYNEPAMVENVIRARNQEDEEFCKVKLSSVRPLGVGQKFSSRHGQKGVCGAGMIQSDMLFSEIGIIMDLIVNPHAIPSRMTIAQLIEALCAKLSAILGYTIDGSIFTKVDINAIGDVLEQLGFNRYGNEQMYNGMTGDWIDVEIFIAPTYYQRLQKFVEDEVYSVSTGPTSAIERQPLEGKANKGEICLSGLVISC